MEEWDWLKNSEIGLEPDALSHGSTKHAFWICKQGHSYKARIDHRCIMGSGCPYCAGKLPIVGINDLATLNPQLIAEWDYKKNAGSPQNYKQGSNKKVWWICSVCSHEWLSSITNRALSSSGCPVCAQKQRGLSKVQGLVHKKGSLLEVRPDLAVEWDAQRNAPLSPNDLTAGSNKVVWWLCSKCSYSYQKSVTGRNGGNGCPVCHGKKVVAGYNDLATKFPQIASEWHPTLNGNLTPTQVTSANDRKVWWHCSTCSHHWESSIYSRTKLGTGCPVCANRIIIAGQNDLATTHPNIALEWHPSMNGDLLPSSVSAGSNQVVWWICSNGHTWRAMINTRTRGRGCPECAQKSRPVNRTKTLLSQKGSLADTNPEIAAQWHPSLNANLLPNMLTAGSSKVVWWQCNKGHSWEAVINSRVRGNGCPICAGELSTSFPEQAIFYYISKVTNAINRYKIHGCEVDIYLPDISVGIEYNGRYYHRNRHDKDAEKVNFLSNKGITVIRIEECDTNSVNGNIIRYRYIDRSYKDLNIVVVRLLEMLSLPMVDIDISRDTQAILEMYLLKEKENSVAEKYPWLINEWNYERNGKLTPWQVSFGSSKKVWWKCIKCKYEWEAVVHSRKNSGCPCCAGRVVVEGINDLSSRNPELVKEWDFEKNDLLPTQITPNSHKHAWWKCLHGHSWCAEIKSRNQGSGCPICYKTSTNSD